jgi:mRNA-degrading endonuclease toxin of MazEF toxin-antitoxin module
MNNKDYKIWMPFKAKIHNGDRPNINFKERDIFWVSIGENVGFEEDGKNKLFNRPVLVIRKFNNFLFWGVPLSTTDKRGRYYHVFKVGGKESVALLSQARTFDSSRITANKLGMATEKDFAMIKKKLSDVLLG